MRFDYAYLDVNSPPEDVGPFDYCASLASGFPQLDNLGLPPDFVAAMRAELAGTAAAGTAVNAALLCDPTAPPVAKDNILLYRGETGTSGATTSASGSVGDHASDDFHGEPSPSESPSPSQTPDPTPTRTPNPCRLSTLMYRCLGGDDCGTGPWLDCQLLTGRPRKCICELSLINGAYPDMAYQFKDVSCKNEPCGGKCSMTVLIWNEQFGYFQVYSFKLPCRRADPPEPVSDCECYPVVGSGGL